jgi:hypothetical protein
VEAAAGDGTQRQAVTRAHWNTRWSEAFSTHDIAL